MYLRSFILAHGIIFIIVALCTQLVHTTNTIVTLTAEQKSEIEQQTALAKSNNTHLQTIEQLRNSLEQTHFDDDSAHFIEEHIEELAQSATDSCSTALSFCLPPNI